MADFTLTIDDADIDRVTQAVCAPISIAFNMIAADTIDPATARERVIEMITEIVKAYTMVEAANSFVPPTIS